MIDLRDLKRQRQAEKLRAHLLRTDPRMQRMHESSLRVQQEARERRQANQKAAAALQFAVGDLVQIRLHRDRLDGMRGTITEITELPCGKTLAKLVIRIERKTRSYILPPVFKSLRVDVELLRIIDAETP